MSDADKIINLCAPADNGESELSPVDASSGSNLDLIADADGAQMGDVAVLSITASIAEALGTNYDIFSEDYAIADLAAVGDNHARSKAALLTNKTIATEITTGLEDRAITDGGTVLDNNTGPDGHVCSERGTGSDQG
jgi:hypothetical protein